MPTTPDLRDVVQRLEQCPKIVWYEGDLLSDALDYIVRLKRAEREIEWSKQKLGDAAALLQELDYSDPVTNMSKVKSAAQILWEIIWPHIRNPNAGG